MNGVERLKQKLANKEKIYSTMLFEWNYSRLPEMYKQCGLDYVLVCCEHGVFCPENIGDVAQACRYNDLPIIARVQDCEYHCISKCIDMGADGVLIPRTETMEQVETAIRSLRMPPVGKKGIGGRACMRPGEDIAAFNRNRLLFIQMESPQGIDLLDEMLTKYGHEIAGVIVGPNDLESSMGYPNFDCEKPDDTYDNYIRKCIEISNKHGKSTGLFMTTDERMRKWYGEGMNIFWVNTELGMLTNEVKRVKSIIDEL